MLEKAGIEEDQWSMHSHGRCLGDRDIQIKILATVKISLSNFISNIFFNFMLLFKDLLSNSGSR